MLPYIAQSWTTSGLTAQLLRRQKGAYCFARRRRRLGRVLRQLPGPYSPGAGTNEGHNVGVTALVQNGDLLLEQTHGLLVDRLVPAHLDRHVLPLEHAPVHLQAGMQPHSGQLNVSEWRT